MPEWMVRLAGPERDLRFLSSGLQVPDCRVIEDDDGFYLRSRRFERLAGVDEVKRAADDVLHHARLAALLHCEPSERDVRIAGVVCVSADGSRHETIDAVLTAKGTARVMFVGSPPASLPDLSQDIAVLKRRPAFEQALSYLQDEPNWHGYYKAYEAVRRANGGDRGLKRKRWTTQKALSRFTHSAQSDRHHDCPGPDDRMSEAEGRAYVRDLLRRWRDEDLSGSP